MCSSLQGHKYWEIVDYAEAYRAGRLTPSQAMRRVIAGIRATEHLAAFQDYDVEDIMEQVRGDTLKLH